MVTSLCIKFRSIWRPSDFGTNLSRNINKKDFENINIKMQISTWPSTSVRNFSHCEELQVLGPNFPERIWMTKNLKKQNTKCNCLANLSQFEELQILGPKLSQNMNEKDFEKINIKMEISTWRCTSVPNFSQFEELQFLGPSLSQKYEWKEFSKKKN